MRAFGISLAMVTVMLPLAVAAQEQPQGSQGLKVPRDYWNLTPDDKTAYCFWAGDIYSLGASFCSRQSSSVTCTEWPGKRPIWVIKDNDKACEKNPSLTPL
jgi:hypothetical protein